MKIILISLVTLMSLSVFGQSGKLKKADNYYSNIAYAEAIPLYQELIGSEVDSPELKSRLANCFYQLGITDEAEMYYSLVVSTPTASSEDVYNYAQALKENGNYEQSNEWMEKFYSMQATDSRGRMFDKNKTYIRSIESQDAYFSISHLSLNTSNSEFGGYSSIAGKVYFVSNKKNSPIIKRTHSWDSKNFLDLYSADIDENGELINEEYQPKKINKKFHEGPICFSADGKKVFYTRNNMSSGSRRRDQKGIQNLKIYISEIDEEGKWINEEEFPVNSQEYSVGHPTLSADGKSLHFVSDMPGGIGGADIYKINIKDDGTFGKPENLGAKINTEGQEMFPWITSEGLLFFSSDGHLGLGGLDVFVMIPAKNGSFKKLMNVGKPVNSKNDDFALIMSKDNLSGYVSSNRDTGSGMDDIYSFKLLRPFKVSLELKGVIVDYRTKELIPSASVDLVDQLGNIIATTVADQKGNYGFGLEEEQEYTINVHKEEYFDNSEGISTKDLVNDVELIEKNVTLEKDLGLALYALIIDAKTDMPLEGVQVTITDNMTGEVFLEDVTDNAGDVLKGIAGKKIDDRLSYNIELILEGYFPKTVTFNHKITAPGQIDVSALLDGGLAMDEEVKDLALLINPINFDLGKWNIRSDAAIELDKIIAVMNEYPNMIVELGAHTDCRASASFNMRLSEKRAKSSAKYIQARITNPERISGKGYGESRLLNECECEGSVKVDCTEEQHQENRRTEFIVVSTGDDKVKVNNTSTDSFDK